jgi:CRP-like cAMP-binding protein
MAARNHSSRTGNRLLDRLPGEEFERLQPHFQRVALKHQEDVYGLNGPAAHVYFPLSSVFCLVLLMEDGKEVETATTGNEGLLGIPLLLGLDFNPLRATTQVAGDCLRLPARPFLAALKQGTALDRLVRNYIAYSWQNNNQAIACNLLHTVTERLCRWLLLTHDRTGADEFDLTQEFLAEMLGASRQTVTVVAGTLQAAGFITYRRGHVRIVRREELEDSCCECYAAMKEFYDRVMG